MREVIYIDNEKKEKGKPVEFTGILKYDGELVEEINPTSPYTKIVYLGREEYHGDMFAAYVDGSEEPTIFKGHLNSGKY